MRRPFLRKCVSRLRSSSILVLISNLSSSARNLSPASDDGGHPRTVGRSGLEIKVCVRTYRLFFVSKTEEYLVRLSGGAREVEKAMERARVRAVERREWVRKAEAGEVVYNIA